MEKKDTHNEYQINLLIDFLSGKITTEEQALLFEWIDKSEENRLYYTQIKELWVSSGLGNPESPFHKEKAFNMFKERVETIVRNKRIKRKKTLRRIAGVAAVLLPFILLIYTGYKYLELKNSVTDQQSVFTSVVAPKGAQSQIELPDGTNVWLNAGSTIRYANTFGQGDRSLILSGEAYFDVTSNKTLPFIVRTEDLKIEVLGTKFNVKAYEGLDNIKVSLIEGSVSLENVPENQTYMLKPMETAIYDKQLHDTKIVKDISSRAKECTNGDIIFHGEAFEEIAFILEQQFNVTIHIEKESLKKKQFKGDFTKNETSERIFNVMATDGQFNYRISDKHIDVF